MSSQDREILLKDSRSENMTRRLVLLPEWLRLSRQRRLLLASSGCIQRLVTIDPATRRQGASRQAVSKVPAHC